MKLLTYILLFPILTISIFSANAQVRINEFMASNYTAVADPDFSLYGDWIELYNSGTADYDLTSHYMTDNFNDHFTWKFPNGTTIPAGGFLVIWADGASTGLHTNFRLSSRGEEIGLYDSLGNILDTVMFTSQVSDVSKGRTPDGSTSWGYFTNFTLGSSNNTGNYSGISSQPVYSVPGGFYNNAQTVSLSSVNPAAVIRYTINGDQPDETSAIYNDPIPVSSTQVIRSISYEPGELPSRVSNRTYFIDAPDHQVAVISISSDSANFWDPDTGFYVNYNEEWERSIGIELYEADGSFGFDANAGVSLYGNVTRNKGQKAFAINFSNQYGQKELDYQLFDDVDRKNYGSFVLRNGGNNWGASSNFNSGFFCDAIQHEIFEHHMDIDLMPFKPAAVYINGMYWGILNIREKMNEEFVEAHYGVVEDSIDMIKLRKNEANRLLSGDSTHFKNLVEYVQANDVALNAHYNYVCTQIDIKSFIDYQIAETYAGNFDWPDNNSKFWRPQTTDGKWRWMMFDLDFGFNGQAWGNGATGKWTGYNRPLLQDATNPSMNEWATILMRKLLLNDRFKTDFYQAYAHYLNTTFQPERVISIINGIQNLTMDEMDRHIQRWFEDGGIGSQNAWDYALGRMREFAEKRPGVCKTYLSKDFGVWPAEMSISKNLETAGKVFVNDLPIRSSDMNGFYFLYDTLNIRVSPYPGYEFIGWEISANKINVSEVFAFGSDWKYLDDGSDQGTGWTQPGFNDSTWGTGNAEFGYGEGDENTVVNYGPDEQNKYVTTYFRKNVNIADVSNLEEVIFRTNYDDGVLIYINGDLAVNENMPTSNVTYQTLALGGTDNNYKEIHVSPASLVTGNNTIAVEVHQAEINSGDLSFDLQMNISSAEPEKDTAMNITEFDLYFEGNTQIVAQFEKQTDIYINEVCARNLNHIQDDYGQYDDWIEIYNPSPNPVDIGGMFISDKLDNPDKWQIPETDAAKTTIPAGGFLLLWADNDPLQGENHLPFALDSEGEQIGLFDILMDEVAVIDSFTFDSVPPNKSFGRYSDGQNYLQIFDLATPMAPNNDTVIPDPNPFGINPVTKNRIKIYPNPASDKVFIDFGNLTNQTEKQLMIVSVTGSVIVKETIYDNRSSLSVNEFAEGIYFLVIRIDNQTITKKIIKQ